VRDKEVSTPPKGAKVSLVCEQLLPEASDEYVLEPAVLHVAHAVLVQSGYYAVDNQVSGFQLKVFFIASLYIVKDASCSSCMNA
jgi:hypothetical protein